MIRSLHIEDFMSLGSITLEFDERNIVSLCGYNDSGKSAVVRALEVLFYNAYSTEQVHFIKDGCDKFRLVLTFDDGVSYERIKYVTGASVFLLIKDDEVLFDNRRGTQVINTDGIPQVIAKYLGVIRDDNTKEALNIRRCTDKLFLIETSGGENYKILNTILQSDKLAETSIALNTDKNKLQAETVAGYTRLSALKDTRDSTQVANSDDIDALEEEVNNLRTLATRFDILMKAKSLVDEITQIPIKKCVQTLNIGRLKAISDIKFLSTTSKKSVNKALKTIDINRLSELESMSRIYHKISEPINSEVLMVDTNRLVDIKSLVDKRVTAVTDVHCAVPVINHSKLRDLGVLQRLVIANKTESERYSDINVSATQVFSKLHEVAEANNLKICENCGAVISKEGVHIDG